MKIALLYASAGAGHKRAAEAIYNELKNRQVNSVIFDILGFTNPLIRKLYSDGYGFTIKYLPFLWAIIFYGSDIKILRPLNLALNSIFNRLYFKKLEQYLKEANLDLVITTHFAPVEIIGRLKRKGSVSLKSLVVITDFNAHSFWVSNQIDEYVVATEGIKDILVNNFQINPTIIRVRGIPIDPKFNLPQNKSRLIEKFNLKRDKFTVLLMTGAFGFEILKYIATSLLRENQVLIVCGNNKQLYDELSNLSKLEPNLKVFGLINNTEELMAVSDAIVTKPGGLTISESLASGLPMIFIAAIAGQETKNARLMAVLGAGFYPQNISDIPSIINKIKTNPEFLIQIKEKIKSIAQPNSTARIVDDIFKKDA